MFEIIDANKAYSIGFLLTDGGVEPYDRPRTVRVDLQRRDEPLLRKFIEPFGGSLSVRHLGRSILWTFNGTALCDELMVFGIVPRKTFSVRVPRLPEDLMPHLIRGIWDGDGTFYIHKNRVEAEISSGSEQFVMDLRKVLQKIGVKTSYRFHRRGHRLSLTSRPTRRLVEYLYPSEELFVPEKKKVFGFTGTVTETK